MLISKIMLHGQIVVSFFRKSIPLSPCMLITHALKSVHVQDHTCKSKHAPMIVHYEWERTRDDFEV